MPRIIEGEREFLTGLGIRPGVVLGVLFWFLFV